ncbi:MAG: hypothetical protein ACK4JY_00130 [Brevundimonas sp.]|uniref:hypothetical protein n=1 Tax=Brevundimonas sp. TaxID=1871086 RepID=UPI00391A9024
MTDEPKAKPPAAGPPDKDVGWLKYGLITAAVFLAWQIVQPPFVDRLPPSAALRLAPSSPSVLRRAAEIEQAAERSENAAALANEALVRAPFDARALRVRGLADAALGFPERADQLLTLAGNWSLRDDPAHAWLVEQRLRVGNYGSSFAHADTLVRRRSDVRPQIFNLFTTAAANDPRALPALAQLLALRPPWRDEYFSSLYDRPEGSAILLALAMSLEKTDGPLQPYELERLYSTWAVESRLPAIQFLRQRINRPSGSLALQNGDFSTAAEAQVLPFGWRMGVAPGLNVEMVEDDIRQSDPAVRIDYDGYGGGMPLQQLILLKAGDYSLSWEQRYEVRPRDPRLAWTLTCFETGDRLFARTLVSQEQSEVWEASSAVFTIPTSGCTAQWLRLAPRAGDSQSNTVVWFDRVKITPVAGQTTTAANRQDAQGFD